MGAAQQILAAQKIAAGGGDYTTGLTLWLRANNVAGNDGDAVGTWTDASAGGNNFTQGTGANQPLLKKAANGLNGQNVLLFDGSNDRLTKAGGVATGTSFTLMIVFVPSTSDGFGTLLTAGTSFGAYWTSNVHTNYYDGGSHQNTANLSVGTPYLMTVVSNGSALDLFTNGAADGTFAITTTNVNLDTIGDNASSETFAGKIAEVRLWGGASVSLANRQLAEDALGSLYGITITH